MCGMRPKVRAAILVFGGFRGRELGFVLLIHVFGDFHGRDIKFGLPSMIRAVFLDGSISLNFSSTFSAVFVDGTSDVVDGKTTRKLRCQCPPDGA